MVLKRVDNKLMNSGKKPEIKSCLSFITVINLDKRTGGTKSQAFNCLFIIFVSNKCNNS